MYRPIVTATVIPTFAVIHFAFCGNIYLYRTPVTIQGIHRNIVGLYCHACFHFNISTQIPALVKPQPGQSIPNRILIGQTVPNRSCKIINTPAVKSIGTFSICKSASICCFISLIFTSRLFFHF